MRPAVIPDFLAESVEAARRRLTGWRDPDSRFAADGRVTARRTLVDRPMPELATPPVPQNGPSGASGRFRKAGRPLTVVTQRTPVSVHRVYGLKDCANPECRILFTPSSTSQKVCPAEECRNWLKTNYNSSRDGRKRLRGMTVEEREALRLTCPHLLWYQHGPGRRLCGACGKTEAAPSEPTAAQ